MHTNRLIYEKSPYLLQHAHNPVDWYPWAEEAFETARHLDRPIFLSIGYATCHWCHVMENESFSNEEIAKELNSNFICIKVDREELPEVDSLYMEFAQSMMSGAAGWPLTVLLTSELKPFFAATYLPAHSRHGLMGLYELLQRIKAIWEGEDREKLIEQSEKIVELFAQNIHTMGETLPRKGQINESVEHLYKLSDPIYGGMRGAPKFPIGHLTVFMLRYSVFSKDSRALFLVERTLDMMHRGGIYDHIGGGFSRYSVDEKWLIPHFEKMLYDNAILIYAYLEAWQLTKRPLYFEACQETIEYIQRELMHENGGFYSAEDADVNGQEGGFYSWSFQEIQNILGPEGSKLFCDYFNVTEEGNFDGSNILNTPLNWDEFVQSKQIEGELEHQKITLQKQLLKKIRNTRSHPFKDDKLLSSWNGLMISSFCQAGCAFGEQRLINNAKKAALFIKENMWRNGRLLRRWRDGEANFNAGLDEYAFMIKGLLSLFEAGEGVEWLKWAMEMTYVLELDFKAEDGAFYLTDDTDPNIILRKCQYSDGAEPSGNAVHGENLLRLHQITTNPFFLDQLEDILRAVKRYIDNYSPGYGYHMLNLLRYYDKKASLFVIALNKEEQHYCELRQLIFNSFIPHKSVIWLREKDIEENSELIKLLPHLVDKKAIDGKTTLYVCQEGACGLPVNELSAMIELIYKQ